MLNAIKLKKIAGKMGINYSLNRMSYSRVLNHTINKLENLRSDYVNNYREKYSGLDLDFNTLCQMTWNLTQDEFVEINEKANQLN